MSVVVPDGFRVEWVPILLDGRFIDIGFIRDVDGKLHPVRVPPPAPPKDAK